MNNNSNTNEIISEVSSAGQTFVSGKVEDGELHVTLKGNPADMVPDYYDVWRYCGVRR